jgi:hypothetical protein
LPALQKVEINKKVQFVELEFSTSENLLVKKAKIKTKEDSQIFFIIKVLTCRTFFCFFLKPIEYTNKIKISGTGVIRKILFLYQTEPIFGLISLYFA